MRVSLRSVLAWTLLGASAIVPVLVAATSDYLAYRSAIYIAAGLAGIVALALLLLQPLLAGGDLPGLSTADARRLHRWTGSALVILVAGHVGGLFLTSPPDVLDALLFRSPTPFAVWGVAAMWALLAAAGLAALRRPLRIRPAVWRFVHTLLAVLVVVGSVVHAMLIEGTMGTISKTVLCVLVVAALAKTIVDLRRGRRPARRAS